MDASKPYLAAAFFCFIVIFGSYFLLNLVLAVIIDAYNKIDIKEKKKEQERIEREAEDLRRRFEAVKTIFRNIMLTEKRQELYHNAGMEYRLSFFDLVFIAMKRLRYQ